MDFEVIQEQMSIARAVVKNRERSGRNKCTEGNENGKPELVKKNWAD